MRVASDNVTFFLLFTNRRMDLPDQTVNVLRQLLNELLTATDNQRRTETETRLNNEWTLGQPATTIMGFAFLARHDQDAGVRHLAHP
jgi:hypothetical protein